LFLKPFALGWLGIEIPGAMPKGSAASLDFISGLAAAASRRDNFRHVGGQDPAP
jgi:hypothetical protein